jgi:hypothetical protein
MESDDETMAQLAKIKQYGPGSPEALEALAEIRRLEQAKAEDDARKAWLANLEQRLRRLEDKLDGDSSG